MISLSDLVHWMQVFASNHEYLIYAVLYILALAEGHIISIICGLFIRLGNLYVIPTALAIIAGNLTGDILLYWAGYHWGERFVLSLGKYVGVNDQSIETAKRIFAKYHSPILLGSKLTNGFGLATVILFTAGMTRVSFVKYMFLNVIGECAWTAILIAVGFFFGHLYITINNIFGRIFITAFIIAIGYILFRVNKYMRNKIENI
ncbi:MAG: VTT domain-containing protein [Patescibacteria group bacterium]